MIDLDAIKAMAHGSTLAEKLDRFTPETVVLDAERMQKSLRDLLAEVERLEAECGKEKRG